MRFLILNLSLLMLMTFFVSCGKKTKVKDSNSGKTDIQLTEDEAYLLKDLKTAVIGNDIEAVKKIINKNDDIDLNKIVPGTGETLLTLAIINDYKEIRNLLLDKGANPEALNGLKQTPLFVAVINRRINSVQLLAELNVNLDQVDFYTKDTALTMAIKQSSGDIAIFLIKEGAALETLDKELKSPIRLAEENRLSEVVELIRSILQTERGAPDLKSFRTLLNEADLGRLTSVLSRYPRLIIDYDVINPLAILVEGKNEYSSLKSAELLLKHQANVNGPFDAEQTPLIKATKSQKSGFANLFLTFKANPQLLDKDGKSALIHAIELNNQELVDLLLSFSAVEKYTFRKDGKEITYNACQVARNVTQTLTDDKDLVINRNIKKSLACRFSFWPL